MKWILIIVAVLIAIPLVIALVGVFLPREHVVSRSAVIAHPPAEVYAKIRDVASAPGWREGLDRVEILDPVDGKFRFREHSGSDAVTYEIVEDQPPQRMATRIVDTDLGYSGTWTYDFAPDPAGTRLTITENGSVPNVIFRTLSRFVFGHTATIDKVLNALQKT